MRLTAEYLPPRVFFGEKGRLVRGNIKEPRSVIVWVVETIHVSDKKFRIRIYASLMTRLPLAGTTTIENGIKLHEPIRLELSWVLLGLTRTAAMVATT